jgi:hypothetical protein
MGQAQLFRNWILKLLPIVKKGVVQEFSNSLGFLFKGTGWTETGIAFSEWEEIFHVEEKECPNQQSDE